MAPIEVDLAEFHGVLVERFSGEELRTLCFYLGVDYDSLPGEGKAAKAREMIRQMRRTDRNGELVKLVTEMRPTSVQLQTGRLGRLLGIAPAERDQVDEVGERAFRLALAGQSAEAEWLRKLIFIMIGVQAIVLLILLAVVAWG